MAASPFSLEGKIAIVTGGGLGIGRSISLEFARAGADVVVASRKLEHLEAVVAEIKALGRRSVAIAVDVRQEEGVKELGGGTATWASSSPAPTPRPRRRPRSARPTPASASSSAESGPAARLSPRRDAGPGRRPR